MSDDPAEVTRIYGLPTDKLRQPHREAYALVGMLITVELGKRAARGLPPSVGDPVNKELERIRDAMRDASQVEDEAEVKP